MRDIRFLYKHSEGVLNPLAVERSTLPKPFSGMSVTQPLDMADFKCEISHDGNGLNRHLHNIYIKSFVGGQFMNCMQ